MEELREMAGILAKHQLKKIEVLNNPWPKPGKAVKQSRETKAIYALLDWKFTSDKEAAEYLGFKELGSAFYSFKHLLQEKILNGMFHIDAKLSGYYDDEYLCSKLRHLVYVLFLYGCRKAGVHFTNKLLSIAEKYNLAEYKMFCYKMLREHFSYTGDSFWYLKNNTLYNKAQDQMLLENKAEDFLNRINVQYARTIAQHPETASEAFKYADEIAEDIKKHDTYLLQYYEHKVRGLAYQIAGEYERSIQIWQDWENYLHEHPLFAGDKRFGETALYRMDNYASLSQYEEAKKCAQTCLKYFREESRNRLIFLENYFLLAMCSGDYLNARVIFDLATANKRLNSMPVTNQEKWKIFEAYLYFVEDDKGALRGNKFDLDGFFQDVHIYKKDKNGFNISMLIVQLCILTRMKDHNNSIEKTDALKLYKRRYLKTDISYRVNVFMDFLFALDKANYSPAAMKKEEALLLKKLNGKQIVHTVNIEGLEVIPFEQLWVMVKNDLV